MFEDLRVILAPHAELIEEVLAALAGAGGVIQAYGALCRLLRELTGAAEDNVAWWIVGGASQRARAEERPVTRDDIEWALALHAGDLLVAVTREAEKAALERIRQAVGLPVGATPTQIAQAVERLVRFGGGGGLEIKRRDAA